MAHGNDTMSDTSNEHYERPKKSFLVRALKFALPLIVLFAAAAGIMFMGKLKPKAETKNEPPSATPVVTAFAENRSVELSVASQGEVRPRTEINLAAQVGGRVVWLAPDFLEGGQFTKGQVILRLESAEYDLRVTQADANVAQAQTVLTREISESDIARRDWDDLGEGKASALTLREPQMAEARARLAAAQAQLGEAKLQQSRTVVYAPFDGRVRERFVSLGDTISAGQNIGRVYGVAIAEVKLPLTDVDMARLGLGIGFMSTKAKPGPEVKLSATVAGEPHTWQGRITRISSSYDSATRVLFAYAVVHDPYGKGADNGVPLASGLFVNVHIAGREVVNSIVVPRTALRGSDTVYIANDDKTLSLRTVKVASSSKDMVVISAGLSSGEQVITSPIRGVAEGMKIELADFSDADDKAQISGEQEAGQ
ncbi:MAG: efflux RND transporter periplasmic adaptor subunit [Robiginitomaculum sp.]|nr:efflux RND transporter periplasmic adaptor subunit [Robiginitomaculum sp.]